MYKNLSICLCLLHVCCYLCTAYISTIPESRLPRFVQRFAHLRNSVLKIYVYLFFSFNRDASNITSQPQHHLARGPLRETYNPKSASLSASGSSSTQQTQSKIPEKIKYVLIKKIKTRAKKT